MINPVTSRAGVTSNAGLAAGLPSGATRTMAIVPSAVLPVTSVTSGTPQPIVVIRPSAK